MAGSNESRPAGQPQNEPPQHPRDSHEMPPHYVPNDICASPAPLESPSESVPPFPRHAHTEPLPDRRRSVQLPGEDSRVDTFAAPARKSMQTPRTMTTDRLVSRDFDLRLDGPFGRPSLTMARRRSSAIPEPRTSLHVRRDQIKSAEKEGTVPVPSTPDHQTDEGIDLSRTEDSASFEPEPPPLNYSLRIRTWAIVIFWSLILIDCIAMPIALYFALTYHTSLSPNTVFSIVTAALGGVSILEYFVRFWRLFKKDSTCRVIGARRMYLDWFHWNFSFGWVIIMIELIVGTVPENPPIRLLAMPIASMLYAFGTELLIVDTLRYFKIPAPIRISAIPKGSQLRPGIYSIIEDVCAVDGSGGTAFREALNRRYEASHVFRAMLRRLGLFWSVGAQGMAVLLTILIFTINEEAAYVVGWAAPFIWAGIWTVITFAYVKYKLREERKGWAEEVATKVAQA